MESKEPRTDTEILKEDSYNSRKRTKEHEEETVNSLTKAFSTMCTLMLLISKELGGFHNNCSLEEKSDYVTSQYCVTRELIIRKNQEGFKR